ncbi:tRNA lysidine(34) synthetase TilS [Thiobacillus sedimenti]|uniref:tRNA(Ile)-lysidine synthase n=1 Tax=Thiobacillus sedimenti TaxID=3110231 RepID=A0ABZ1CPN4_9PROT|nr:tRNA lysidine(34) synthetase TilS [Thiobacillus sp. SCUT-2]WRS39903.1 tRNA lysidine(34) synthetase TilS [Thiobacillus sp. SCUT-2]
MAAVLGRHVPPHARLVLALSGGLDSVVLLHALLALRDAHPFELRALHVHHGLSPHADAWADFCGSLCTAGGVELAVHRVQIARDDPAGVEAAARRERQRVFAAADADFLLTAHHQDDQAETLLLQLLRGAGPKGLAAMAEQVAPRGWRAVLLRPFLNVARAELSRAAEAAGLAWVDDESNVDVRYRRNALRHEVMPLLARHFPGAGRTLARAAALQADAAELLDDLARLDGCEAIAGERLDCAALARLPPPRARNLLRHFFEQSGQPMPPARRLDEALHQLRDAHPDARVRVDFGPVALWRYRGGAYLVPLGPPPAPPVRWQGEARIWVPAAGVAVQMATVVGAGLRRAALEAGNVTLGVRQGGERLRLHADGPHRSLKNLLQEHAIPPWARGRLPLLWCDGRLVWVAGIGFDADHVAAPGEAGVLPCVVESAPEQDSRGPGVLS